MTVFFGALNSFILYSEYLLVRVTGFLLNCLPFSLALGFAKPMGYFLFLILRRARRMALENLNAAYGAEKSEAEIRRIAVGSFVHLAEFAIEWLRMPKLAKDPERYLGAQGEQALYEALRKKKKGAVLLVSHSGNQEIKALIAGRYLARPAGVSIGALARPLKNPFLYRYARRLRGLMGLESIDKQGGVRSAFKRLKQNGIVCILIDQRVSEGNVETSFFGRPALTTGLPAICALRMEAPLFFVFLRRTEDLKFVMEVEGPVPIQSTGNANRDIQVHTQKFMDRIETEIRKEPRRWLWMHNRWRVPHGPKD